MNLRRSLIVLGIAGAVGAMVVGGAAFAQTPVPGPAGQAKANYRDIFLDKLAGALGITRDKLDAAFTQARNETVDQQVKGGRLTRQQADRIKAREGRASFGFGFPGFGKGQRPGVAFMGGAQVRDAIARALGMTPQDLASQLKSGKTLADLAQGKEQAVKDAVVDAVKPQLDQAVSSGKMTQERENQILDQIRNSDLAKLGRLKAGAFLGGMGTRSHPWGKRSSNGAAPSPSPTR